MRLRKAIQQNPRYVEAHNNLAQLLFAQKKEVEALRILGDALKFAPKNVQTLLITAQIQLRRNNLQAAEQAIAARSQGGARECRSADAARTGPARDRPLRRSDRGARPRAQEGARQPGSAELLRRRAEVRRPPRRGARVHPQGAQAQRHDVRRLRQPQRPRRFLRRRRRGAVQPHGRDLRSRSKNPEADQFLAAAFRLCEGARRPRPAREGARALHHRRPDEARPARL